MATPEAPQIDAQIDVEAFHADNLAAIESAHTAVSEHPLNQKPAGGDRALIDEVSPKGDVKVVETVVERDFDRPDSTGRRQSHADFAESELMGPRIDLVPGAGIHSKPDAALSHYASRDGRQHSTARVRTSAGSYHTTVGRKGNVYTVVERDGYVDHEGNVRRVEIRDPRAAELVQSLAIKGLDGAVQVSPEDYVRSVATADRVRRQGVYGDAHRMAEDDPAVQAALNVEKSGVDPAAE